MYQIKNRIYLNFDKTQKSGLCNYLRALVKQNLNLSLSEILDKFIEDEKYYLELNASRFPFLADLIDDAKFLKDTEEYLKECIKYYEYKEKQRPIIEAQKECQKRLLPKSSFIIMTNCVKGILLRKKMLKSYQNSI